MSRLKIAVDFGESLRSQFASIRLLASAHSCAQRVQLSLENLGGASNLLLLTGVGTGLVVSFLSGLLIDRSRGISHGGRTSPADSRFAGSASSLVNM